MKFDHFKIFTGTANPALAKEICKCLKHPLSKAEVRRFSDGEIRVQVSENVRGCDVFVVQPTCSPGDTNLMELLFMIDALKRASARRITPVIPYYGYARQDRKDRPRVPISAKLVASLIERAGADRVLTMELHAAQIQGFFDIPVDHLFATPAVMKYFKHRSGQLMVVSPDAGGVERARALAKRLEARLAIIDKRRSEPGVAEVLNIIGDVKDQVCLMVDDLIDTAGTMREGADALLAAGAKSVSAFATHPVLSGPAVERICSSKFSEVVVTNSIPLREDARNCGRIRVLTIGPLLAKAIKSIHIEDSVSKLFV